MKRPILALLTATILGGPAFSADLKPFPVKAPVYAPVGCTITSCIGLFIGPSIVQAGGSLDVIGTGITGLADNGFAMGGQAGYEFFRDKFYFSGLFHAERDMSLNAAPGTSFNDRMTWGACARVGYQLSGLLGATTSGNVGATPTLPQELLSSLMTPYVNVCEDKRHNQPSTATGVGLEILLAADGRGRSAWTANIDYLRYNYRQGGAAGTMGVLPIVQTSDNVIKVGLNYHFGL